MKKVNVSMADDSSGDDSLVLGLAMLEPTSVEQGVLNTLKILLELGISTPRYKEVAHFSRFPTVRSVGFVIAVRKLLAHGFIEFPGSETVRLTSVGIQEIGPITRPISNKASHECIRKLLHPTEAAIFDELLDGCSHEGHKVAEQAGYPSVKSIGYMQALSTLQTLGLLEFSSNDKHQDSHLLRLTKIAFPHGRPILRKKSRTMVVDYSATRL